MRYRSSSREFCLTLDEFKRLDATKIVEPKIHSEYGELPKQAAVEVPYDD